MLSLIDEQLKEEVPENPNILEKVPIAVKRNVCFIINLKKLFNDKDILADNNGSWTALRGAEKVYFLSVTALSRSLGAAF
ncbi:hypothetical protein BV898_19884 [Hypsibius exemplaris]|uniref:Uncharacterized protein n=1 Tax=Hypsibius exemplaris TaxID=2072580 RepID=A0A9X6NM99_HYPEX|nr:hypothetical protein BV898_19884 [Hypsibius exemplaris]